MIPHPLLQIIIIPPLASLAIIIFRQKLGRGVGWIARGSLVYTTILLLIKCTQISFATAPFMEYYPFAGPDITFNLLGDGISLPVALIIALLCMALSFYADHYIEHRIEAIYGKIDQYTWNCHYSRFYALFLFFPTGFMGVCFATNLVAMYFFLEILPLPLYFIMAFFGYVDRVRVALICLMWAVIGAGFFLVGLIIVYLHTGSFAISSIHQLSGQPVAFWIIIMFMITILAKMAVVPFQVWMPWVHAEHPTCIAGLLAVYANIAVYVMLRILIFPLANDFSSFSLPLMTLALITMVYGALLTLAQTDIKRFAACSTISQLAYSFLGITSMTQAGIEGGMYFFLSHIMGKTILFSTAGILVYTTGIRDMRQLGGLARKMPITTALWIIGAMMLSGFPPMSSFPAEWVMFTGIFKSGINAIPGKLIIAIGGAAAITLSVVYCFRSVKIIFFGPLDPEMAVNDHIKDPPLSMSLPLLLIATVSIAMGLFPQPVFALFHRVISTLAL
ncbi:MAG: NADH-quinone oxidoreductase subunit M [Deltaproteobacteria bacterium]|nr:NADH-quinone oxidoreductase subunit M [Candidatus Tharpellaceae bacterium]